MYGNIRQWFPKFSGFDNPFPYITNNAVDSFGYIKLYDTARVNVLNLRRLSDQANKDIPWLDNYPNKSEITNFGVLDGTDRVRRLYAQKNTEADLVTGPFGTNFGDGGDALNIRDKFDFTQGTETLSVQPYPFQGSLAVGLRRNTSYLACTYLARSIVNSGDRTLFKSELSNGLAGNYISITNDGYSAGGRRIGSNGNQALTVTGINPNLWHVITVIWDFGNRELIIRVDGTQVGILTTFQQAGNTEDLNANYFTMIGSRASGNFGGPIEFAHMTFWNTSVALTEIQEIEDYYANIKAILP